MGIYHLCLISLGNHIISCHAHSTALPRSWGWQTAVGDPALVISQARWHPSSWHAHSCENTSPGGGRPLWVTQHLSFLRPDGIPAAGMLTAVRTQVLGVADCCGCPSTCQFSARVASQQLTCSQLWIHKSWGWQTAVGAPALVNSQPRWHPSS